MTTISWVQNENGEYEISSVEHLKQLMNEGNLYTDAGTPPANYWGSGTSYIQTVDIDLLNNSSNIKPIGFGGNTSYFRGNYDGAEYSISNYSYVDPNFNTTEYCERYVGLFSQYSGSYVKNMRLNGLWTIRGYFTYAGFFMGRSLRGTFSNIECDFAPGSFMETNDSGYSNSTIGGVWGAVSGTCIGITLKGSVDFRHSISNVSNIGGITGYASTSSSTSMQLVRNLATFPSGIYGKGSVGGIFAVIYSYSGSMSRFLNAMVGDIIGSSAVTGGILGAVIDSSTNNPCTIDNMVNCMTGNIQTGSASGGIIGSYTCYGTCEHLLNYMTGDIIGATDRSGGIVGNFTILDINSSISSCINAMNGNVHNGLFGSVPSNSNLISNTTTATSFGLTFPATETFGNGTPTGFLTDSEFTDLPYFDLTGTDGDGYSYDFEFVYANLLGNSSYSDYTHLVLHRGDVHTPYDVTYGLPTNNTTVYRTYFNVNTLTVTTQPGLTGTTSVSGVTVIELTLLDITTRAINLVVDITEVPGSIGYRLTVEGPTGGEVTKVSNTLVLRHNLVGLLPETTYTIRMYSDTGSGYTLSQETSVTTLVNSTSSYDMTDFQVDGVVSIGNIADLGDEFNSVMNDVFNTGDVVEVSIPSDPSMKSSFIKSGEVLSIKEVASTLIPFSTSSGVGQSVGVTLSDDSTTVPINYDETSNSITVDSVTYNAGSSFILDGRKVTVIDV